MRYMLDTDTASYVIKGKIPALDVRLADVPPEDVCISSVTREELLYGVRRRPGAHRLARVVDQFLVTVQSLPWDDAAATLQKAVGIQFARPRRVISWIGTRPRAANS
jgi:tRNA(fMet)-specific endonuclease VapC